LDGLLHDHQSAKVVLVDIQVTEQIRRGGRSPFARRQKVNAGIKLHIKKDDSACGALPKW